MKRIGTMILALLACAPLFAGGAGEEGAPVTLTVWDFKYGEDTWRGAMDEVNALFMERNPDIAIEMVAQPGPQYYELVRVSIASQDGPDVGLFHAQGTTWELSSGLVTLDQVVAPWRDAISETSWEAVVPYRDSSNGIKLVPMTTQGFGWYYNRAILAEAGVAEDAMLRTPEGFRAALQAVQEAGYRAIIWGNTPGFHIDWLLRAHVGSVLGSAAVEGFADGSTQFEDPEIERILEYFVELRAAGYFDDTGASTTLFMDGLEQFQAGEGAFVFGLLSDIAHWRNFSDALGEDNVGFFPVVNFPGAVAPDHLNVDGAGIGYGVLELSDHKDAAFRYLEFLGSAEAAAILVDRIGAISPNAEVTIADPEPALAEILRYIADGRTTPAYSAFVPGSAIATLTTVSELLFNAQEIGVNDFLVAVDREVEAAR